MSYQSMTAKANCAPDTPCGLYPLYMSARLANAASQIIIVTKFNAKVTGASHLSLPCFAIEDLPRPTNGKQRRNAVTSRVHMAQKRR